MLLFLLITPWIWRRLASASLLPAIVRLAIGGEVPSPIDVADRSKPVLGTTIPFNKASGDRVTLRRQHNLEVTPCLMQR